MSSGTQVWMMDKLRDVLNVSIMILLLGFISINLVRIAMIGLERSGMI